MSNLYRQNVVRYLDAAGRRVSSKTPGARRVKEKSTKWYGQYRSPDGAVHRVPLCKNKTAAQTMLAEIVTNSEKGQAGLVDQFAQHRAAQLSKHVDAYKTHLEAKGNTPKHVRITISRINAACEGCGFSRTPDFDAAKLANWLKDQREDVETKMSIATSNYHLRAVKGFVAWMIRDDRTDSNPFIHVSFLNSKTDRRLERRSLSAIELVALLTAAEHSTKVFRKLTGKDRAMLYRLASCSGLRAHELATLTRRSLDLTIDPPTLTVKVENEKSRRGAILPLNTQLAELLSSWIDGKQPSPRTVLRIDRAQSDECLWPGTWFEKAAKMLRIDLKAAGIEFEDDGKVFDFHSLRGQFISDLGRSGVTLQEAQKLARHSDPRLTANHYTHLSINDLSASVNRLTIPTVANSETVVLQATGTTDATPDLVTLRVTLAGDFDRHPVTTVDTTLAVIGTVKERLNPRENQGVDINCESLSVTDQNSGERTRTSDPRLMNPQAVSLNAETRKDFGQGAIAGYTPGYTGNANLDSNPISDPDLLRLIELWPQLPLHLRKTIRTLIDAAGID